MNYTELKASVIAYSHRGDLDGMMDTFTQFAEAVMDKELRVSQMEKIVSVSYPQAFNDLPDDYLEMRSLRIDIDGTQQTIPMMTPDQLTQYFVAGGISRDNAAFALHGNQIEIRPEPDSDNPLTGDLSYYARIPSLVNNPENPVLDNFPTLYLAAMMTQVHIFTQDTEELQVWDGVYNTQLALANKTADSGRLHLPTIRVA